MTKKYYITTTLPYVNAKPHIGFALEIVQADVLARYHRLNGAEVIFNTGTDEHGLKIYRKATEEDKTCQEYCDEYAAKFNALKDALNLSYTNFIRTTDLKHLGAAQEFWRRCLDNGDIYKKIYQVKYCVGCELEKTDSELVDGKCPVHPGMDLELIDEENYFFKFSNYTKPLLEFYKEHPDFVVPESRYNEIKSFVKNGLQDFSISRIKQKMPWGVSVPDDKDQVMYVWFDALVNYISTLDWPNDESKFKHFWPGVQVAGKDNLRQQSAMWQAMLMSAGLPNSKQVFIHGFISSGGQKMSKSLGNVIDPQELIEKYGTDAVRYYLLGALPAYDDGDFGWDKFEEYYSAHLANGVGNLNSRVMTMLEKYNDGLTPKIPDISKEEIKNTENFWKKYDDALADYRFDLAVEKINEIVKFCDQFISTNKPWEKVKNGESIDWELFQITECLRQIGVALLPFMPVTAQKILKQFDIEVDEEKFDIAKARKWGNLVENQKVNKSEALFPRLVKEV